METVRVAEGQTLTDIAVQVYGDAGQVIRLAVLNRLSVTADLKSGQILVCDKINNPVTRYFSKHKICVATKGR